MKKYSVTVNGAVYEVVIEDIVGNAQPAKAAAPAAAVSRPAQPVVPASAPAAVAPPEGGERVAAPMPGNILRIHVTAGDSVKRGQVLFVLEAMKMENEIMAPCDGKVASVHVAPGAVVESGMLLCVIA